MNILRQNMNILRQNRSILPNALSFFKSLAIYFTLVTFFVRADRKLSKCGGHAFSTYERRREGGGSSKSVRHTYKEEKELTHLSTYAKSSLYARALWYFHMQDTSIILCCLWRRLSLLFYKIFV